MTHFISLKSVEAKEPAYLWPDRIAKGCLTVIEGNPGENKTTLTHDLTARVTTGRPMPNCTGCLPPGNVMILQAEDDPAATIRPNLDAMGANLENVFVFGKQSDPLSFPEDVDVLAAYIEKLKAKLVIVDPITSFFAGSINSERVVRRSLAPLVTVAEKHGIAVVLVRHFTKSTGGNPLYRGGGSIAVTGLARSVLQVGIDPKDPAKRVIVQAKSNLNAPATSLSFKPVQKNGGLTLEWLGESDCTVDHLHATATKQDRPALEFAQYALFSILAKGPVPAKDAMNLAREAGVEKRTLRRAKESLGVKSQRRGFGPESQFFWVLPDANDIIDRLRQNEMDDLFDKLFFGDDDALPDQNDASDPASWWKKEPRDDVDDADLDGGIA